MTLEQLIELARANKTPEEKSESIKRQLEFQERMRQYDKEMIARNRCSECGVDTLHYSHTFKCSWRGM